MNCQDYFEGIPCAYPDCTCDPRNKARFEAEYSAPANWAALDFGARQEAYDYWKAITGAEAREQAAQEKWFAENNADYTKDGWAEAVAEAVKEALDYEWASMDYPERLAYLNKGPSK
jgi:hypothetical protein